jgi:hypothetical protein
MHCQQINEIGLKPIGILVFVHQDELKVALIIFGDARIPFQQADRLH